MGSKPVQSKKSHSLLQDGRRHTNLAVAKDRVMFILIGSLAVLAVVAAIAGVLRTRSLRRKLDAGEIKEMPGVKMVTDCGADSCELDNGGSCEVEDCLKLAVKQDVEYYDDEELDAFRGMASDGYDDEQVAAFSEVLDTMQPDDVAGWLHSLELRGIALPDRLKDEAYMLLGDRRGNTTPATA